MSAGQYRHLITFQRRDSGRNEFGESVDRWADVVTVWAAVEPLSGREFFAALQSQTDISVRIRCRYSASVAGVTPRDRIRHGSAVYDIRSLIDREARHREFEILCTQRVE